MNIAIVDVTWAAVGVAGGPVWLRAAAGASAGLVISVGKELWDAAGHGDPSLGDLTFDALGIGAGIGFALAAESVLSRGGGEPCPCASGSE